MNKVVCIIVRNFYKNVWNMKLMKRRKLFNIEVNGFKKFTMYFLMRLIKNTGLYYLEIDSTLAVP